MQGMYVTRRLLATYVPTTGKKSLVQSDSSQRFSKNWRVMCLFSTLNAFSFAQGLLIPPFVLSLGTILQLNCIQKDAISNRNSGALAYLTQEV